MTRVRALMLYKVVQAAFVRHADRSPTQGRVGASQKPRCHSQCVSVAEQSRGRRNPKAICSLAVRGFCTFTGSAGVPCVLWGFWLQIRPQKRGSTVLCMTYICVT